MTDVVSLTYRLNLLADGSSVDVEGSNTRLVRCALIDELAANKRIKPAITTLVFIIYANAYNNTMQRYKNILVLCNT